MGAAHGRCCTLASLSQNQQETGVDLIMRERMNSSDTWDGEYWDGISAKVFLAFKQAAYGEFRPAEAVRS